MDRVISRNQRTLDCTRGADGSCHQSQSTHLGLYSRSRWIVYAAPPTASASTFAARAVGEARSTSLPDEGGNQVQSGAIRCNQKHFLT